jgi:hypothetical protein
METLAGVRSMFFHTESTKEWQDVLCKLCIACQTEHDGRIRDLISKCDGFLRFQQLNSTFCMEIKTETRLFTVRSWRWKQYVRTKHPWTFIALHTVISQTIVLFIVTAARTGSLVEVPVLRPGRGCFRVGITMHECCGWNCKERMTLKLRNSNLVT